MVYRSFNYSKWLLHVWPSATILQDCPYAVHYYQMQYDGVGGGHFFSGHTYFAEINRSYTLYSTIIQGLADGRRPTDLLRWIKKTNVCPKFLMPQTGSRRPQTSLWLKATWVPYSCFSTNSITGCKHEEFIDKKKQICCYHKRYGAVALNWVPHYRLRRRGRKVDQVTIGWYIQPGAVSSSKTNWVVKKFFLSTQEVR